MNTACASGANAIGLAADLVRTGRVDAVLAGGTDALSDVVFAGFSALEALSPIPPRRTREIVRGFRSVKAGGMLLLMSVALANAHQLPVPVRRDRRLWTLCRWIPRHRAATGRNGRGQGDTRCPQFRRRTVERGRLHQRSWHRNSEKRPSRNQGDQACPR